MLFLFRFDRGELDEARELLDVDRLFRPWRRSGDRILDRIEFRKIDVLRGTGIAFFKETGDDGEIVLDQFDAAGFDDARDIVVFVEDDADIGESGILFEGFGG
jgi:hypothetical protein